MPFSALPGAPTDPVVVAHYMTDAAKAITDRYTAYQAPVGGGTRFGFLFGHPEFELPEPQPARIARVLQQGLTELRLSNQRRGVEPFVRRRDGLDLAVDGPHTTITGPAINIDIRFDDQGLFSLVTATLGDRISAPMILEGPGRSPRQA